MSSCCCMAIAICDCGCGGGALLLLFPPLPGGWYPAAPDMFAADLVGEVLLFWPSESSTPVDVGFSKWCTNRRRRSNSFADKGNETREFCNRVRPCDNARLRSGDLRLPGSPVVLCCDAALARRAYSLSQSAMLRSMVGWLVVCCDVLCFGGVLTSRRGKRPMM